MESLFETLYAYAEKERFDIYILRNAAEWEENEHMVRRAMEELNACGMANAVQRVTDGLTVLCCLDQRAAFWAGLSIGLELNRL